MQTFCIYTDFLFYTWRDHHHAYLIFWWLHPKSAFKFCLQIYLLAIAISLSINKLKNCELSYSFEWCLFNDQAVIIYLNLIKILLYTCICIYLFDNLFRRIHHGSLCQSHSARPWRCTVHLHTATGCHFHISCLIKQNKGGTVIHTVNVVKKKWIAQFSWEKKSKENKTE